MPKKAVVKPAKKRGGRSSRVKGTRAEVEFVEILRERGVPAARVLGSGAYGFGAKADVKVGLELNPDGSYPAADEGRSIMRAEVKNRADNPEHLFTDIPVLLGEASKEGNELVWKHLNQDAVSKALVLRRGKVPVGSIVNKNYNQVFMVCMGIDDWIDLFKKAYGKELGL